MVVPSSAHIHEFERIPSDALAAGMVLPLTAMERPIVYRNRTWFPRQFGARSLQEAFEAANEEHGWTEEDRAGRKSWVAEHNTGTFKVRISLHVNPDSPDLITAYPVSLIDRNSHPDFFHLDEYEMGWADARVGRQSRDRPGEYDLGYRYGKAARGR